ncbi:DUF4097 family beta strand repeat-containing protein [Desertivirga arenae]|uniref:DUF4097 family beta strand repeat-containing protein n=1 Tax=Desertivirga arenae TaxID=2810309 RepID=UPI001A975DB2|nr:DUF4097 family beta strand repeat-containing protein [Pedobacter sp. SYSU D00823]
MKTKVFNIVLLCVLFTSLVHGQNQILGPKELSELKRLESLDQEINSKVVEKLSQCLAQLNGEKLAVLRLERPKLNVPEVPQAPGAPDIPEPPDFNQFDFQDSRFSEKSKSIVREYKVDGNDKLAIDNQFGNVQVNSWSNNSIKVEISIKAFERDDEKAEELLNNVSISESKEHNVIGFVTHIARANRGGDFWGIRRLNGVTERRGVEVNYTIYMPSKNPLDVTNKYGNVTLPVLSGIVNANCSYGNLRADKLLNSANRIKVAYGKANIDELKAANLDIAYGGLTLESADNLNATVSYSSAKIGKLSGDGSVNVRYCGGFKIAEVDRKIKTLNVDAAYSNVSLSFEPAASFDFDVTVSYGGFNYGDDKVVVVNRSPETNSRGPHFTKNYKGQIGKGSDAKVVVNSKYGSVHFN